ncbi:MULTISPECIES: GNAT family N-acetyltransferase [unclassified Actinomyces]|uniref:GNAT family N-acetyltransferase n=1 Tax=unclassified Actinomyces TaxID=2609248 RepID=UPI002017FF27|nr:MULTISPECIES: GNAT family N-acetyltransferase [unclassified Actinomyces]MCL3776614.1 GNAT family N-acetyltransferase [Actinomyces sp. AC-20-1]MCL3790103.1 GNAT family N-acetyltransferase [Actinomyces sp. 187325]MCL3792405.1 GNAT family N-acetyltransferase [Actinomyces sp. 186855]MCL3793480.1 GNAT family N-acetyltransferase [Actinomyces sp. 217892]
MSAIDWYVRPARREDEAALNRICVATARHGDDVEGEMNIPALVGAVYSDPYLRAGAETCRVAAERGTAEDKVLGYVVGTYDSRAFETWFRHEYAPARVRELNLDGVDAADDDACANAGLTRLDRDYLRILRSPGRAPEDLVTDFPAHVHINLVARARRLGAGRALMSSFAEGAREAGVPGLHLGAGEDNLRALAFYRAIGMVEHCRADGVVWMRQPLC